MLHALFFYKCFSCFPIWLNHRNGSQNLTYLSTYLPTPKIYKAISRVRETGSKQSSSPSHSRRDTLITDRGFKGEEREKFPTGKGRGNAQRSPGWVASKPLIVVKGHIQDPELYGSTSVQPDRLECCINATVSRDQSWGSVLMLRGRRRRRRRGLGKTWHHLLDMHRPLWEFCHSTLLHTSFPCLDSHQSYDSENTGRWTIMYFWGISVIGFVN